MNLLPMILYIFYTNTDTHSPKIPETPPLSVPCLRLSLSLYLFPNILNMYIFNRHPRQLREGGRKLGQTHNAELLELLAFPGSDGK